MEMAVQQRSNAAAVGCRERLTTAAAGSPETEAEAEAELRRGPWTVDEDLTLINYIADHGEGRWNALARAAGLQRTGKSCRLRWLNYLRPDVKRGNFTAEEQLLILDLHSRWGNRWSKIAQHLPGRTDNEIKNYWRTRVQKHAKQLNCDVNSQRFKDAMRYLWMPRLAERVAHAAAAAAGATSAGEAYDAAAGSINSADAPCVSGVTTMAATPTPTTANNYYSPSVVTSSTASDDYSFTSEPHEEKLQVVSLLHPHGGGGECMQDADHEFWSTTMPAQCDDQFQDQELSGWVQGFSEGISDNLWSLEDIWKMQ